MKKRILIIGQLALIGLLLSLSACAYQGKHPDTSTPPWPRPLDTPGWVEDV